MGYVEKNLITGEHIVYSTTYHWIIFISLKALLTLFISPLIKRYSDEFVITNKRIVMKTGLIGRDTFELNLSKVESVNVKQSLLARMLNYGDVQIIGTGGSSEIFKRLNAPIEFRKKFQEQIM